MEKSVEEDEVMLVESPPERRTVRRRLVQSTLFQQKSQLNEDNGQFEEDDEDDDEEEYCGSQSKSTRKRNRKSKGRTKSRTPPKKAPVTGKDASDRRSANKKSLLTVERSLQKKQQKGHGGVSLPERNNNISTDLESMVVGHSLEGKRSRLQFKQKREGDASPCKKLTPGKLNGPHCRRIVTNYKSDTAKDVDEHAPEPVDLWLEAKIAAEENTRLFTGRRAHPFFSSRKVGKRFEDTSEATELDSKRFLFLQEGKSISCRPVHVFEVPQDDIVPLDWRSWIFYDKISFNSGCAPEHVFSSVFEGSVGPLKFDDFQSLSNPVGTSLLQNDASLSHSPSRVKDMYPISTTMSSMSADGQASDHQLEYLQTVHERCEGGLPLGYSSPVPVINWEIEPAERLKSYYLDCGSQPNSSLWTIKYQPEKASEVCGNGESVRFLNEWLCSWGARYSQTHKNSTGRSKGIFPESDYSWDENDSDTESMDGVNLKNVLLVTGPVGSGKSAAIYACAKEQGFQVIEVSASDWRNGAHVRQKFGEAMESLGLNKWSLEDPGGSRRKHILECLSAQPGKSSVRDVDDEVVELISETCKEEADNVKQGSGSVVEKAKIISCSRGQDKTLILFEDVDTVFDEDRGFITTIQQIAETAKRPMILTSNSKDSVLPDQLDRLEVCFTVPSLGELLSHLCMVCAAEEADIQPQFIERFIESCQGDIRKTIMLLQFWCQGKRNQKDRKHQCAYGPLQVDIDAGHLVVPKVIPWGFPCQLAELVEKEISGTLSAVKENALLEVLEEERLSSEEMQDALEMDIEAKKEAMLSRNCSIHDDNEFSAQIDIAAEFSNSSSSPVAFTRRTVRQRPSTVLSSHSGDEFLNDQIPANSDILSKDPRNEILLGVSGDSPAQKIATEEYLDPSIVPLHYSELEISDQNIYKFSKTEGEQHICDTHKSVSCVPESSFVLETEVSNEAESLSKTVSCCHVAVISEAVTLNGAKSIHSLSTVDINNLDKDVAGLDKNSEIILRNTCGVDAELVHGDEEVGDSQIEHAETVTRDYQGMDECSRADFNMGSISVENRKFPLLAGSVQETWRKLRICHPDLKLHVTSEQKDASKIVKLVSGMTDLISVADLMLGCCEPLTSDSLEPSLVPCVEPDAFCWYHKQLEISSTVVQHGFCFFAKECAATGSSSSFRNRVDIAWEMLASTTNTAALGKLVTQDMSTSRNSCAGCLERPPRSVISLKREVEEHLYNTILNIVPSKSCLALKGAAFHEYVSTLGQISRLEASRLLKSIDNTKQRRRRARAPCHYLSTGPLMLSPKDVSLLAQHSCHGKLQLESMKESYR